MIIKIIYSKQPETSHELEQGFRVSKQTILAECELVKQKGREIYYPLEIDKMKEIGK
jgi:hypothetical protein